MTTYFADYRWSKREPKGISPIDDPAGKEHFRLFEVNGGMRLEQFDEAGKFRRLVYCPHDAKMARGTTFEVSDDHTHNIRRSEDGAVRSYEVYVWPDGDYSEDVHPEVRIFNEHGRLVWQHRPQRVSESAWDIHVFDALGKPRVVLHHTDCDGPEPDTIVEEWLE